MDELRWWCLRLREMLLLLLVGVMLMVLRLRLLLSTGMWTWRPSTRSSFRLLKWFGFPTSFELVDHATANKSETTSERRSSRPARAIPTGTHVVFLPALFTT